jgi:hypothetical protein
MLEVEVVLLSQTQVEQEEQAVVDVTFEKEMG